MVLGLVDEHVDLQGPGVVGHRDLSQGEVRRVQRRRHSSEQHIAVPVQLDVDLVRLRQPSGQVYSDQPVAVLRATRMDRFRDSDGANVAFGQVSANGHLVIAPRPSTHSPSIGSSALALVAA